VRENHSVQSRTKALATIGFGPMAPVLDVALKTFRSYASAHGYDLVIGDGSSNGRPPAWGKVSLLRHLLDTYEEVLWIDSDAIILDQSVDLRGLVPDDAFQAIVFHAWNGQLAPNTGVWFIRRDRGRAFLDAIWAMEQYIDHPIWENGAVCELLGFSIDPYQKVADTEWMAGTTVLDEEWNRHFQIAKFQPGRIRHYAGMSNEFRRRRMLIDLDDLSGRRIAAALRRLEWRARGSKIAARASGSRG
jgi:hypothetical protein